MNEKTPRIAFFGTSDFAVRILEHMESAGLSPTLVVTQPDKPQGRKLTLTPPPVKDWALANSIPVIQPETLKTVPEELTEDFDVFVVVAYGNIIPKTILDLPQHGALNIHPSLLPKLRGPSPIQSAILTDSRATGVTLMMLDEEMDHGPIVAQASIELEEWPVSTSVLSEILADIGGELLTETLVPWINGEVGAEPQDHTVATYCTHIRKEDAKLDLSDDPYQNLLKIKAFDVWPQAFYFEEVGGKQIRVKVLDASIEDGKLRIHRVVPENKKEMTYDDFLRGLSKD